MERPITNEGNHQQDFLSTSKLWKYADLARYLNVSEMFCRKKVMQDGIPYIRIGRLIRFSPAAIEEWLKQKTNYRG